MASMARPSSVLCPSCGTLVGVKDPQCLSCGRRNPGMWGFAHVLRDVGEDMGFTQVVMFACGALFLATLAADLENVSMSGLLSMLSPSGASLFLFGASGAVPVFDLHRWWTVLSASWLHGGILHILFNMLWVRDLARPTARLYGPGRTVIIYTAAGVAGFLLTSAVGHYLPGLPFFLRGAQRLSVGASASIFGLIGALYHYGRRGGSSLVSQQAKSLALTMLFFGFVMPGVDNWAHLGGFAGGFLTSKVLDPLRPERGDHVLAAIVCLVLSAMAVALSFVTGRAFLLS
jgi:rhomboid protease GluP